MTARNLINEALAEETWNPMAGKPYAFLGNRTDTMVRTAPLSRGYLWQCRQRYGFSATLDEAKAWAEALAEHYSLPAAKRWMTL